MELQGSCLCGKVSYRAITEHDSINISHCHCVRCQKAHAAAFATYTRVNKQQLTVTGLEHLQHYDSSAHAKRSFCQHCGSHLLFVYHHLADAVFLTVATLDQAPAIRHAMHIYTKSKADWCPMNDDLPQYAEYPKPQHKNE